MGYSSFQNGYRKDATTGELVSVQPQINSLSVRHLSRDRVQLVARQGDALMVFDLDGEAVSALTEMLAVPRVA